MCIEDERSSRRFAKPIHHQRIVVVIVCEIVRCTIPEEHINSEAGTA